MGRVGRYTLKLYDNNNGKEYDISLLEQGQHKKKVDLMTIDRFINKRYIGNGKYERFDNKEELKNYLTKFKNINISNNFNAFVSYQSNGEETNLELIYNDNKTIQYFSQMFLYFKEKEKTYDEVNKRVISNNVWKVFANMFEKLINEPSFYEYITKDSIGRTYIVKDFRKLIMEYNNNCGFDDHDSIITRRTAMDGIRRQLASYKTIRGIELAIARYNVLKKQSEGLDESYLDSELYHQEYKMPLEESTYYGKDEAMKETIKSLNDEELNANIGGYTTPGDLAQKLFEEEGLSLEEVLADPELASRLGYTKENENKEKHR